MAALEYLKMWASNGFRKLIEQRLLDFCKLRRVHNLENILYLIQEHDFFCTIDLRPIP